LSEEALVSHCILLVEDDEKLGRQVVGYLREAGFRMEWLKDGDEALAITPRNYSLMILDLMLPGKYGLDVLKRLRTSSDLPVLVLSARNDTGDKVRALELGADDYLTKPFWPEELVARVQARLRRPVLEHGDSIQCGDLAVNLTARRALVKGAPIELTKVEFDLLAVLVKKPGAAVARQRLVDEALDPEREGTERTLDVHMSRLRRKLGSCARSLQTVWGVGYRLEVPGSQ
jgi:DNA-binding response OmpR family regulator